MTQEKFGITGELNITLRGADGAVKESIHVPNLVVAVGKNYIASRMIGNTDAVMTHMAVGTSTSAPATSNTTLGAEAGRAAFNLPAVTNGNVVTYSTLFAAGVGTAALTEAGIFNSSTAGTMLCRTTFPVVNKGAFDTLTISWNVTVN
jgi:hypothetical protein